MPERELILQAIDRVVDFAATVGDGRPYLSADLELVAGYARGALDRQLRLLSGPIEGSGIIESNVRLQLALGRIGKAFGYPDGECEPELLAMTVELFVATMTPCRCGHTYVHHRTGRCATCTCESFDPVPWGSSAHKRIEYQRAAERRSHGEGHNG